MGYWDRILKYMRGGPDAIDAWPNPIPIEEFNQAVGRTLGSALAARVTRLVIAQAMPFFETVRAVEDLPSLYRERRSLGLPFASFP